MTHQWRGGSRVFLLCMPFSWQADRATLSLCGRYQADNFGLRRTPLRRL